LTFRGFAAADAGWGGLCRPESVTVAKNARPVSGPAKPFPGKIPACEQRLVRISAETGSSPKCPSMRAQRFSNSVCSSRLHQGLPAVGGGVDGQKSLGRSRTLEPLHLALPASGRLMRVLRFGCCAIARVHGDERSQGRARPRRRIVGHRLAGDQGQRPFS
jgi:hypothetical protein